MAHPVNGPLQTSQASTGIPAGWILHGLQRTSGQPGTERRLLGKGNSIQHAQFSERVIALSPRVVLIYRAPTDSDGIDLTLSEIILSVPLILSSVLTSHTDPYGLRPWASMQYQMLRVEGRLQISATLLLLGLWYESEV